MILVVGFGSDRAILPPPPLGESLSEFLRDEEPAPVTLRTAPTILVVDDDADVRDMLAALLRAEKYTVETASDGLDALNKLFDGPRPEMILLDIRMPRMNGIAFLRCFEMTSYADVPVLLISADKTLTTTITHDERYLFITKPPDVPQMLELIDRKIQEGRKRRG